MNQRIIEASKDMVEKSKLSLENCREYMTKEWLKSLLLKGPQKLSKDVEGSLRNAPDDCLKLVLKGEAMMGEAEMKKRIELTGALKCAWDLWTGEIVDQIQIPRSSITESIPNQQNESIEDEIDENVSRQEVENEMRLQFDEDECDSSVTVKLEDIEYFNDTEQTISCNAVWDLNTDDRRKLIAQAVKTGYTLAMERLKDYMKKYEKLRQKFETERRKSQLDILQHSKVVGMTTSGAAINQQLLNELKAAVVFVEEAAEVLESNLLASLTPHVKHLILIGDHMQLKPKIACNRLKEDAIKFDTSLFLRLVENKFPYTLLMNQSRMRPEMVRLYGHHYKEQKRESNTGRLQSNMEIVGNISQLSCMATSVFWWDHNKPESSNGGGQITNDHEVKMVVALCLWILSCGDQNSIGKDDITILTPYRAQRKAIEDALKKKSNFLSNTQVPHKITTHLSQLKVHTVDEFQGDESNVIILSLVRNNSKNTIGFLSDKHRHVVAVSRQKCGLYIVGSAKCLSISPIVWKPFIAKREEHKEIGDSIAVKAGLQCTKPCRSPEELEQLIYSLPKSQETTPVKPPARQQSSPAVLLSSSPDGPPAKSNSAAKQTSPELHMTVSIDCILDLHKSAMKDWKFLGRILKLVENTITSIERDYKTDGQQEMCYQMLLKWKEMQGENATYENLIKALVKANLNDLVRSVKSQVQKEWEEKQAEL